MTLPREEVNALARTRNFLRRLLGYNLTEIRKDAREIKKDASSCLKHFPWQIHIEELWEDRINDLEIWRKDE